ncbi:MAG TPA: polymorphic toxin-type HINT domain-containing protein, partial [Polyangia bacterium]
MGLIGDVRGGTIEWIILIGVFALALVGGVRYLSRGTNTTLTAQGACVANGGVGCDSNGAPNAQTNVPPRPGPIRACTAQGCMCFVAGTLVVTRDGLQPIETIEPGTEVLSRHDTEGDETAWKPVVQAFVTQSRSLVRLTTVNQDGRTETFETTGNHPFFVENAGWVDARDLVPDHHLLVDGDGRPVRLLMAESLDRQVPVYNFEVADYHTYFVGHSAIWVHNRPVQVGDTIRVQIGGQRIPARVTGVNSNGTYRVSGVGPDNRPFRTNVDQRGHVTRGGLQGPRAMRPRASASTTVPRTADVTNRRPAGSRTTPIPAPRGPRPMPARAPAPVANSGPPRATNVRPPRGPRPMPSGAPAPIVSNQPPRTTNVPRPLGPRPMPAPQPTPFASSPPPSPTTAPPTPITFP